MSKSLAKRASFSHVPYLIEGLEQRTYFVGDILGVAFSPGINITVPSPYHTTLTTMITPSRLDPNYTGAVPQGSISVGWWGGPVLATVPATTTPTQVPLTLDASNAGTRIASGNYVGQHVLYINYSGDGTYVASTYTETDFEEYQNLGVPGYGVQFSNVASSRIAVTAQPTNSAAGARIDPPVQVATIDSNGSVMTSSTASITVALATTSTGTGTLRGTTTVAEVNGVATFSDLSINTPGQYSLTFHDTAGDTTASGLFEITGGKLVFRPGPRDGTAGDPLTSFSVVLEDSRNHVITSDSSSVVTLTPIGLRPNPIITGNIQQLVNGRATFSNLVLRNPDLYKLSADDGGDAAATSSRFKVAGDKLKFVRQPGTTEVGAPVPLTVEVLNARGLIDTAYNGVVQLVLNIISGGANAHLNGATSIGFAGGVAAFAGVNDPTINARGAYTLGAVAEDASTGVLAPSATTIGAASRVFRILGLHLSFFRDPERTDVHAGIPFVIKLLDEENRLVTSGLYANDNIALLVSPSARIAGMPGDPPGLSNGLLVSTASHGLVIDSIGTYTLTATAYTDVDAPQIDPVVAAITSRAFQIRGFHLAFKRKPPTTDVNSPVPFVLQLLDADNRPASSVLYANDLVSLLVSPTATIAGMPGDPPGLTNGVLVSTQSHGLVIDTVGTFTLTATSYVDAAAPQIEPNVMPVTSLPFKIRGFHLVFKIQPSDTDANSGIPFTIVLENADNRPAPSVLYSNDLVALAVTPTARIVGMPGDPPGLTSGALVSTQSHGLVINSVGTYTLTATSYVDAAAPQIEPNVKPVTSEPFKILGLHLAFSSRPLNSDAGVAIPFTIRLEDSENRPVTTGLFSGDNIALSIAPAGSYTYPIPFPLVSGEASSTDTDGLVISSPGVYVLTATAYTDVDAPQTDPIVMPVSTTFRVIPASRVSG